MAIEPRTEQERPCGSARGKYPSRVRIETRKVRPDARDLGLPGSPDPSRTLPPGALGTTILLDQELGRTVFGCLRRAVASRCPAGYDTKSYQSDRPQPHRLLRTMAKKR